MKKPSAMSSTLSAQTNSFGPQTSRIPTFILGLLWETEEVEGLDLQAAYAQAYNRWVVDFCSDSNGRLIPIAHISMGDGHVAAQELERAVKAGAKGAFFVPFTPTNKSHAHPDYDPFWAEVQELDFAISLHEGSAGGMPQVGVDRFTTRAERHIISHPMEMMLACLSVIWSGVCERFPKVRIGFLESGGGWVAPWLDRMDRSS